MNWVISRLQLLVLATLCAACGGNSLSGPPPTVQVTDPVDGQVFADGVRAITVRGTGTGFRSVTVKLNGVPVPSTDVTVQGDSFTAAVTLGNNSNTIEAIASGAGGSTSSGVVSVTYPFISLRNFQEASVVIGQPDFLSDQAPVPPSASTLNLPLGRVLVSDGRLYLPDSNNNRVLVYNSIPAANGVSASLAIGQAALDTADSGTGVAALNQPSSIAAADGKFFVADKSNNRVLIFNSAPATKPAEADAVLGWDDLYGPPPPYGERCSQAHLYSPQSLFVAGGQFFAVDAENNRVLIWSGLPTSGGDLPDLVLGQGGFDQCTVNRGSSAAAATMNYPSDVWTDGTRLAVADASNNRVLIWSSFPTKDGELANIVVGQTTATATDTLPVSGASLNQPRSVWSNGNQLFVADANRHRVLIWNTFPTDSGTAADVVLGQNSFGRRVANDDDQDLTPDETPTARTLYSPTGVAVYGNQLFVTDMHNNRVLIFNGE